MLTEAKKWVFLIYESTTNTHLLGIVRKKNREKTLKNNLFHKNTHNLFYILYKHLQNHVMYWLIYDWTGFTSKFILITFFYMIKTHEISWNSCKLGMHQIQYVFRNFDHEFGFDMALPVSWTFQLSYVNIVDHQCFVICN
jgi:hypothetical protein